MNILAAAILTLGLQTAEEDFQKLEKNVTGARTVTVRYEWELTRRDEPAGRIEAAGLLLLKGTDKARLSGTIRGRAQQSEIFVVSDGDRIKSRVGANNFVESGTPQGFNDALSRIVVRGGALQAVLVAQKFTGLNPKEQEEVLQAVEQQTVSDVQAGEESDGMKTLTYTIRTEGRDDSDVKVKLWYAPKSTRLARRTFSFHQPFEGEVSEVYEDFSLDEEIPDEKFGLPTAR